MLKRKPIGVLFTVVAAIVFLFGATNSYPCNCAGGSIQTCNCTPDMIDRGECFITSDGKFTVEIIRDESGNFPWTVDDNNVFKYRICQPSQSQNISNINVKVGEPCGIRPYPLDCINNCQSTPPGNWITVETGESSTRFGSYDPDFDVYRWNLSNFCSGEISLTMNGRVYAAPNHMLLRTGSSPFPVGRILGPSCIVPDKVANSEEVIAYETGDYMRCVFDQRGNLIDCFYFNEETQQDEVLKKYPVGNVTCTLTGPTQEKTMTLEFVSDKSKLSGHGSPGAVWYTYRGKLICKEVPKGSGGCP